MPENRFIYAHFVCIVLVKHTYEVHMLTRKTMNLPKDLLEAAVKATGATNQTMAVIIALKEIIRKSKLQELSNLKGKVTIDQAYLRESRRR